MLDIVENLFQKLNGIIGSIIQKWCYQIFECDYKLFLRKYGFACDVNKCIYSKNQYIRLFEETRNC